MKPTIHKKIHKSKFEFMFINSDKHNKELRQFNTTLHLKRNYNIDVKKLKDML